MCVCVAVASMGLVGTGCSASQTVESESTGSTGASEQNEAPGVDQSSRLPLGDSPVRGPADAEVTMVLFCPGIERECESSVERIGELQKQAPESIRLVFKHIPSPEPLPGPFSGGPGGKSGSSRGKVPPGSTNDWVGYYTQGEQQNRPVSPEGVEKRTKAIVSRVGSEAGDVADKVRRYRMLVEAERRSLAAQATGQFWTIEPALFDRLLSPPRRLREADDLEDRDVDFDAFLSALDEVSRDRAERSLKDNMALAKELKVGKVPTVFVNGKRVTKLESDDEVLKGVFDKARAQASKMIDDGVDRSSLYRKAVAQNLEAERKRTSESDRGSGSPSEGSSKQSPETGEDRDEGDKSDGESADTPIENANFAAVDAGYGHTCAIKKDGRMRCWGRGSEPENDTVGHNQAVPPPGRFRAVSGGYEHTCAIRTDGLVDCWSFLYTDEFAPPVDERESSEGDGKLPPRRGEKRMLPDGEFERIDATETRTCGIETDGTAVCWSDEPNSVYSAQGPMPLEGTYQQISPERAFLCTLDTEGQIECKGNDAYGRATPPNGEFVQVVTGATHGCARREDGSVECWGRDYDGQASPPEGSFETIDADGDHSCGVLEDGRIRCWGHTAERYADEHRDDYEAVPPPEGSFKDVSVGVGHNCALRTDDSIVCWGADHSGQVGKFGESYDNEREEPPPEHDRSTMPEGRAANSDSGTTAFDTLAIGGDAVCAVRRRDGGLDCWGIGTDPEEDAEGGTRDFDKAHPPNGTYQQVVMGEDHSCGLRKDGWVDCWGLGANPVFNLMSEYNQASPKAGQFVELAAGTQHVCGLRPDGRVDCWGRGYTTEAGSKWGGRGEEEEASPPSGSFVEIEAAGDLNCVRSRDGSVECWTLKTRYGGRASSPSEEVTFQSFALGSQGGCGLSEAGRIQCWGEIPEPPAGEYTELAVGSGHGCGLDASGEIECWGSNDSGQTIAPRGRFDAMFASGDANCAIETDSGRVQCWGARSDLLTPPGTDTPDPPLKAGQRVGLRGTAVEVVAGRRHTCARLESGEVRCWGGNGSGQLGVGDTEPRKKPAVVDGVEQAGRLAAGREHTCAMTDSKELFCWGANGSGQAGERDGRATLVSPGKVNVEEMVDRADQTETSGERSGEASVLEGISLDAAGNHNCMGNDSGEMFCWGANQSGQLGTGRYDDSARPTQVRTLSSIVAFDLDKQMSCARRDEGDVFCFGRVDSYGLNVDEVEQDVSRFYGTSEPLPNQPEGQHTVPLPVSADGVPSGEEFVVGRNFACGLETRTKVTCTGELEGSHDFEESLGDVNWPEDGGIVGSPLRRKYGDKANVVDLEAGRNHVCAVLAVGQTYCWGENRRGQLGTGGTERAEEPERVDGVRLASAVSAGPLHTCVRTHRGGVKCWGDNRYFQLGRSE